MVFDKNLMGVVQNGWPFFTQSISMNFLGSSDHFGLQFSLPDEVYSNIKTYFHVTCTKLYVLSHQTTLHVDI